MLRIEYEDRWHAYKVNGRKVPSVTTVLDDTGGVGGLPWWGFRVGMAAVVAAMSSSDGMSWAQVANSADPQHIIRPALLPAANATYAKSDSKRRRPRASLETWAIDHKLTPNHLKEEAGLRGTEIHVLLEMLARDEIPDLEQMLPPERRGFGRGLLQWFLDQDPVFHESECIVGSDRYGYAGRFDALCSYGTSQQKALLDLKTTSSLRLSHGVQLSAYRHAYFETLGWEDDELDEQIDEFGYGLDALHVTEDGRYSMVRFHDGVDVFLAALALYTAKQDYLSMHHDDRIAEVDQAQRGRWG